MVSKFWKAQLTWSACVFGAGVYTGKKLEGSKEEIRRSILAVSCGLAGGALLMVYIGAGSLIHNRSSSGTLKP